MQVRENEWTPVRAASPVLARAQGLSLESAHGAALLLRFDRHRLSGSVAQARRRGHPAGSPVFTVVFRPAALDKLDGNMVNVNIPAIPDRAEDQNPTAFYFGKIRQVLVRIFIGRVGFQCCHSLAEPRGKAS